MDAKQQLDIINRVFSNDPVAFEIALTRLRLQADLVQIRSKIAVVQEEADKVASGYVMSLDELSAAAAAKQAEIDALEKKP